MTTIGAVTTLTQELRSCFERRAPKKQDAMVASLKQDLPQPLTALLDHVIKKEKKGDESWRDKMALFKNSLTLKRHCGPSFNTVLRKAEVWTLYVQWQAILAQNAPEDDTVQSALKVKELLYNTKDSFFQHYFSDKQNTHRALASCIALQKENLAPDVILQTFIKEKRRVKARIQEIEDALLAQIGKVSHVASSVIRAITGNLYVQWADHIVEAREKALEGYPALQIPKEGPYIALSKVITALGLLGIDIAQWGLIGLPENLLHSIAYQVSPGADKIFTAFEYVGKDEKTAQLFLPAINRLLQFTAFLGITTLSSGVSLQTVGSASVAYLTAVAVSNVTGKIIDCMYKKPKSAPTHPLVSTIAKSLAFPLAHAYLFPYLEEHLQTKPKPLTREEAERLLNVTSGATAHEINKAFREKAAACHPDKPTANITHLHLLQKAKETLV